MSPLMITILLVVVGGGLVLAGLAHVLLPRALGWTSTTHAGAGPLSALVVRMHVYFLGLFLAVFGGLTVAAALTTSGPVTLVLDTGGLIIFGIRAMVEIAFVGRAVRAAGSVAFARLHRLALVAWPLVSLVYVVALVEGLRRLS